MATTPVPAAPTLPAAPDPSNRSTFNALAYAWSNALGAFSNGLQALAVNAKANADDAATSASTATTAKTDAQAARDAASASAVSAAAASGAIKWVSGTTYAEGVVVWSPVNQLSYRRKTTGAGTTDPSTDTNNWTKLIDTSINTNTATLAQVQAAALCF